MRIGYAIDRHQLVSGRDLVIGGVKIEYEKGLLGHSDADVLVHAIAESIIGALGMGDLGSHFPDNDPKYEGISSLVLLQQVYQMMDEAGYCIGNIDSTVMIEKPHLSSYKKQMEENIAGVLHTDASRVNVKATRGEKLGIVGQGLAVEAYSVCLLEEKKED